MNNIKTLIIVIIFSFLAFGCKDKEEDLNQGTFSKVVDISLHENLNNELGIYSGRYIGHNSNVNIAYTKTTSIDNSSKGSGRITVWSLEGLESGNVTNVNGGDYYVNDIHFKHNGLGYVSEQLLGSNNLLDFNKINGFIEDEVIGKKIKIKNELNNEIQFDEEFYVPEQIHLSGSIENLIEGTAYKRMDKNNFTFGFNRDEKNEHGILITLKYRGESYGMTMDDIQNLSGNTEVSRAVHLKEESTGDITIPKELFTGIPSNAIVTMHITRGSGKLFEKEGKQSFIRASTSEQIRVVLD